MQAPMDNFAAVCLLGDLFPSEWPPAGGLRKGTANHPAPTEMRSRAAFARSIEPATDLFRLLIKEAATSESRIMRCALVRLCARASGELPLQFTFFAHSSHHSFDSPTGAGFSGCLLWLAGELDILLPILPLSSPCPIRQSHGGSGTLPASHEHWCLPCE